jgi:hypothetical protein
MGQLNARRLVALHLSLALCASPALAQTAGTPASSPPATAPMSPKDEAIAHFNKGLSLFEEQDYTAALAEFRRAYQLSPNYKVQYNIGQVCFQMQDFACALRSFETYLSAGGKDLSSDRKSEVVKSVERLRARVAKIEIVTSVAGVLIAIDDIPVGTTPLAEMVAVNAGRRKISGTADGRVGATRSVDVVGGDSIRVELDLPPIASTASVVPASAPVVDHPSKFTTLSWVGLGATGALAIGGGITGLLAVRASKDLNDERFAGPTPTAAVDADSARTRRFSLASDVLFGAAIVTLGATLYLTLSRDPEQPVTAPTAALRVGPTGVVLLGSF